MTEWPLREVIDSVFYMGLDSNGQVPSVPSKYWSDTVLTLKIIQIFCPKILCLIN